MIGLLSRQTETIAFALLIVKEKMKLLHNNYTIRNAILSTMIYVSYCEIFRLFL